jgi:hypothetical protein
MEDDMLAQITRRLVDRLSGVSGTWFGARLPTRGCSRAERLRDLVLVLTKLGREAGNGAPDSAVPNVVGMHALAAQVALLVYDIRRAPKRAGVSAQAAEAVRACYDDLWLRLTP